MAKVAHEVKFGVEVDVDKAISQLNNLNSAITGLDSKITSGLIDKLNNFGKALSNLNAVSGLAEFGSSLKTFGANLSTFTTKINSIDATKFAGTFGVINDTFNAFAASSAKFSKAATALGATSGLKAAGEELSSFVKALGKVNATGFSEALNAIGVSFAEFASNSRKYSKAVTALSNTPLNLTGFSGLKEAGDNLRAFGSSIAKIDAEKFAASMSALSTGFAAFATQSKSYAKSVNAIAGTTGLKEAGADLAAFGSGVERFATRTSNLDLTGLTKSVKTLTTAFSTLPSGGADFANSLTTVTAALKTFVTELSGAPLGKFSARVVRLVEGINELVKAVGPLTTLSTINTAVASLGPAFAQFGAGVLEAAKGLRAMGRSVDVFDQLAARVAGITTLGTIVPTITALGNALAGLAPQLSTAAAAASELTKSRVAEALTRIAAALTALSAINVTALFNQQAAGIAALNTVLTSSIANINNYAKALIAIANASRSITSGADPLAYLTAQAAGVQLLSNSINPNIANLTAYSAALKTMAQSMSVLARAQASMSGTGGPTAFATGLNAIATTAPAVIPALNALTAALVPFSTSTRNAASAVRSLASSLNRLLTSAGGAPAALSAAIAPTSALASSMSRLANSTRSAFSSLRGLSSGAANLNFSTQSSSIRGLSSNLLNLNGLMTGLGAYFTADKLRQGVMAITDTGANFANAMGFVRAVSRNAADYSAENFAAMEKEALRLGRSTTYSATQAAAALKELTQGGLTTRQATEALAATMQLAEIEEMKVADAARIVTSTMAQFQASAAELDTFIDQLAKTSAVTKTSIDQLKYALSYTGTAAKSANQPFYEISAALGALSTAGVESSKAGTTLRDFLSDLTDTTSYSFRKLLALGLSADQINPRLNKLSQIIKVLKDRGVDAADAMAIFGVRGGLAAGSLITIYDQYLQTLNAVQNQSKGTAATMQADVTGNLRKDIERLSTAWDYLQNRIFKSGFENMAQGLVKQVRGVVLGISDAIDALATASKFGQLSEMVKVGLEVAFGESVNYLLSGLISAASVFASYFINSRKLLFDPEFLKGLFDVGKSFAPVLISSSKSFAASMLEANRTITEDLIARLLYGVDLVADKLQQAVIRPLAIAFKADSVYYLSRLAARDSASRLESAKKESASSIPTELDTQKRLMEKSATSGLSAYEEFDLKRSRKRVDYLKTRETQLAEEDRLAKEKLSALEEKLSPTVSPSLRSFSSYQEAAKGAVTDIISNYKQEAEVGLSKAQATLGANLKALGDQVNNKFLAPTSEEIRRQIDNFAPLDIIDTTQAKKRLKDLYELNKPVESGAPTKSNTPVTGKQPITEGVGPANLKSAGGGGGPRYSSLTEVGGMAVLNNITGPIFVDPLQRNTDATNRNTEALLNPKGTPSTPNLVAPAVSPLTESQRQTDLQTWARTGKIPERLKTEMDRVNAIEQDKIDAQAAASSEQLKSAKEQKYQQDLINASERSRLLSNQVGTPFGIEAPLNVLSKFGGEQNLPGASTGLYLGQELGAQLGVGLRSSIYGEFYNAMRVGFEGVGGNIKAARFGAGMGPELGRTIMPFEAQKSALESLLKVAPIQTVVPTKEALLFGSPLQTPNLLGQSSSDKTSEVVQNTADIGTSSDKYGSMQVAKLDTINSTLLQIKSVLTPTNGSKGLGITIS